MISDSDIARFADVCVRIASEASDESGFVPIRNLLTHFRAAVHFRPLLVEGMLASLEGTGSSRAGQYSWAVLIDSETHNATLQDLERETPQKPLSSRLRNTIAHELVHSLAFRYAEFGIHLPLPAKLKDKEGLVGEIERATERLSPLLLVSELALSRVFSRDPKNLSVEQLCRFRSELAVSREVLINRINMLSYSDRGGILSSPRLQNVAIGLGEWDNNTVASLRSWPLYSRFDGNVAPSFTHELVRQDRLPWDKVVPGRWHELGRRGMGPITFSAKAGISKVPDAEDMQVTIGIEHVVPRKGRTFLFVATNANESKRAPRRILGQRNDVTRPHQVSDPDLRNGLSAGKNS